MTLQNASDIATMIGIPIAVIKYFYDSRKNKLSHIMTILDVIGSEDQRTNRRIAYRASKKRNAVLSREERRAIESMSVSFDRIGMYAYRDSLFRKIAIENHCDLINKCWKISNDMAKASTGTNGNNRFVFFKYLAKKSENKKQKVPTG